MRFDNSHWHSEQLKDSFNLFKGNGLAKSDLSMEGKECILYGHLYTTYLSEIIDEVVYKTSSKLKNAMYSNENDVIIPASGETPEDIAKACCIKKAGVLLGGDLNILRTTLHDGAFTSYQLNSKRKYQIAKLAVGKTIVHLHNDDLKNLILYFPDSIQKEKKIATFLHLIDKRISTQKKIIRVLEAQKKVISHKIYNNINAKTKLGNLITYEKKTDHKSEDGLNDGIYPFYTNEENTTKFFNSYDYDGLYILANTGGKANFKLVDGKFAVMSDTLVIKFKQRELAKFYIDYFVNNRVFINQNYFAGSGLKHLNKKAFLNFEIPFVENNVEHISYLFTLLNKKIIIAKKILSLYEKQKQYLLNHMFI